MRRDPLHVLLVEDSADDCELFSLAIGRTRSPIELATVTDGESSLLYLQRRPPFTAVQLPDVIVLDINLPKRTGLEVLRDIKADPVLRPIPVIMLSTSNTLEGIGESYCGGACCYLTKPDDFPGWLSLVEAIAKLWTRADFAAGHVCR